MEAKDLEYINKDLEAIRREGKIINPENFFSSTLEEQRHWEILRKILESEKPKEQIEEYKDFIFSPKYNRVLDSVVDILVKKTEFHEILKGNFQQIREASNINNVVRLYEQLKNVIPEEYEKNKFVIEKIYKASFEKLHELSKNGQISWMDFSRIMQVINITCARIIIQNKTSEIEEIIKNSAEEEEPEVINLGANSIVIRANDKIFKIGGKERNSDFNLPYHPRLLRPIIRKNISEDVDQPLYFEIQEEVDTANISEQDVLEVYKELREAGIKWCDPRTTNLGRLKKENRGYPIGQGPEPPNYSLGLLGDDSERKILQQGDLVILDLDYIFYADDSRAKLIANASNLVRDYENCFLAKKNKPISKITLESLKKQTNRAKIVLSSDERE